jgi:hypothetical protein
MLRSALLDLQFAMRQIRRGPDSAFTVILTLALSAAWRAASIEPTQALRAE